MTDAYVGEIRLFTMDWVPNGWLPCDGRTLTIQGNQALASLLGNQYGGDGKTTFNLPDLRGRVPVGQGANPLTSPPVTYAVGNYGGLEGVALTAAQVPPHTHSINAVAQAGNISAADNAYLAEPVDPQYLYAPSGSLVPLASDAVSQEGAGAAHNNMQPSLVLNFCICTAGLYPSHP